MHIDRYARPPAPSWVSDPLGIASVTTRCKFCVLAKVEMRSPKAEKHRKGEPFSIRLKSVTEHAIEQEAIRTRRSKGAIVEALAEEAMRTRRFPGIGFRGDDAARRPWVIGSGLDVWETIQMLEDFGSIERLVEDTQLTERQARLALAYRDSHPDEIAEAVTQNRRTVADWHELFPFVEVSANSA